MGYAGIELVYTGNLVWDKAIELSCIYLKYWRTGYYFAGNLIVPES